MSKEPNDLRKRDIAKPLILAVIVILVINAISGYQDSFKPVDILKHPQTTPPIAKQNQAPPQATQNPSPNPNPNEASDAGYKNSILSGANNPNYKIENLNAIAGPQELSDFIKQNSQNPAIYTPSVDNIRNGVFRANLHIHTNNSDGAFTVQELLDQAETYAEKTGARPFYLAITDHNTLDGLKTAINILQTNPTKYRNIKLVLGIEVFSVLEPQPNISKKPIQIHVLCWGINPYDPDLNKIFFKKNPSDPYNYTYRTLAQALDILKGKGIVGIAHPMRYVTSDNICRSKEDYYNYLTGAFLRAKTDYPLFAEGYYQSYTTNEEKSMVDIINSDFLSHNVVLTGSTDSHGHSIFKR